MDLFLHNTEVLKMIIALEVKSVLAVSSTPVALWTTLVVVNIDLCVSVVKNMDSKTVIFIFVMVTRGSVSAFNTKSFECGPYGFVCEGTAKLRLCEGENLLGPAFLCPPSTRCNEDSNDVCESNFNYIDPSLTKNIRCHRNERIADPTVPGCKGYILCIPNKNRFQGIKFKCTGSTIFNGYTRTCSAPSEYKCPIENATRPPVELFVEENRRINSDAHYGSNVPQRLRPIECKDYKFSVTNDNGPVRAAYFCPPRPVRGEASVRCTIFSSKFCVTLERDDTDIFTQAFGAVSYRRKPRM